MSVQRAHSTLDPTFIETAHRWLSADDETLVLLRYPNSAGNRDFVRCVNGGEFDALVASQRAKTSVIVIRNCRLLKRGIVDEAFIDFTASSLPNATGDWLLIGSCNDKTLGDWTFCEDRAELRGNLRDRVGLETFIFAEPDWFDEIDTISAYVPDADGIARPGAY